MEGQLEPAGDRWRLRFVFPNGEGPTLEGEMVASTIGPPNLP
ncbi:MAG: hypothetical protein QOE72_437 [Chloroflexota bacterium]|jgi:hypothetical protein|nr:hypothetical protein [Chloroflexota bacterium]